MIYDITQHDVVINNNCISCYLCFVDLHVNVQPSDWPIGRMTLLSVQHRIPFRLNRSNQKCRKTLETLYFLKFGPSWLI